MKNDPNFYGQPIAPNDDPNSAFYSHPNSNLIEHAAEKAHPFFNQSHAPDFYSLPATAHYDWGRVLELPYWLNADTAGALLIAFLIGALMGRR